MSLYDAIFLAMGLGGRLLLTLLAIDLMLLLTLEIIKHGNFKNRSNRSQIPKRQRDREDTAVEGRTELNGVEVLAIDTQRLSTRLNPFRARPIIAYPSIFVPSRNDSAGTDGDDTHTEPGATEQL